LTVLQHADHAVLADAGRHLGTRFSQLFGDPRCGLRFLE